MWIGTLDPGRCGRDAPGAPRRRPGTGPGRQATASAAAFVAVLAAVLAIAGCEREEPSQIAVEPLSREAAQAAPPGEVVALLRRNADPGVTIYEPPPDLSRVDLGVVYVPGTLPQTAPAGADTAGAGITGPSAPAVGPVPQPDTLRRPAPPR